MFTCLWRNYFLTYYDMVLPLLKESAAEKDGKSRRLFLYLKIS
ncbi:hypothetical protein C2W63_03327 [Bacillus velezensis]|nr:hypothetical protein C2W63_03327 [Bacillus velezensis]